MGPGNYLRGTWKGWREESYSKETKWCSKITCLGMRRGGIFEPQREYHGCYLQHWHLLLDMLRDLHSGLCRWSGYSPFTALINRGFPFSRSPFCKVLEAQLTLVVSPRRHKGVGATKASLLLPAHLPLLSAKRDLAMVIRQLICTA